MSATAGSELRRLWSASLPNTTGSGPKRLARRATYVAAMLRHRDAMAPLLDAAPGSLLARTVAARPELLGLVQAPYIHAGWDAATRVRALARHVDTLTNTGFGFDVSESIELMSLADFAPDWHVVLDRPAWLQREGVLALNLFKHNIRWFSIAFAIEERDGLRELVIGGIQGRNLDGALDEYRELTRLAHGLRPRDLLIELLRTFARTTGAARILAVSDACRHHRSPYFGAKSRAPLPLDYDEIWRDRGGLEDKDGFFALPVERQQREIEEIPAKKRQMYRRRYALLDTLDAVMASALNDAKPVVRPEAG